MGLNEEKKYKVQVITRDIAFTKGKDANGLEVRDEQGRFNMGAKIPVVYYEYDRDTRILKYGAAMFTVDKKDEKLNRDALVSTAKARFEKRPVIVENFDDDKSLQEFHERLKQQIGANPPKVKGKKIKKEEN